MRKLALFPLLALALACSDGTLLQPDETLAPEIAVRREAPKMVPFKGVGTFVLAGGFAECDGAGTYDLLFDVTYTKLTHLGNSTSVVRHCYDSSDALLWVTEAVTAGNGDQLYGYCPPDPVPIPPGYFWALGGCVFVGGTGRFQGATGQVDVYGTADEFVVDGVISSVGSI
jgi:hypothetical protein